MNEPASNLDRPPAALAGLGPRWQALAPRERRGLALAALALGLYFGWALAVQPAWQTLRSAPARLERLEAELQSMQRLAEEAARLRALPSASAAQAGPALQAATARLGSAGQLTLQGDRAVLTLRGCPPEALADWLAEARSGARARAVEARLTRSEGGLGGTVVVSLGGAP